MSAADNAGEQNPPLPGPAPDATPKPSTIPWKAQFAVTLVLLVAFFALVWVMLKASKASDDQWKNLVYVFGSCEALAFTAVGWVFGTQVQRSQVAATQATLQQVTDDAKDSKADAMAQTQLANDHKVNLARLATAVKVGLTTPPPAGGSAIARDVGIDDNPAGQLSQQHAALLHLADEVDPTT